MSRKVHPIMRQFDDKDESGNPCCDDNKFIELKKIASVSQIHHCMPNTSGSNERTGIGCRFDFPKKKLTIRL